MSEPSKMHWLRYGGGRNSTALAILLCEGKLPQYEPFRITFSDTHDEKLETYAYIWDHFQPFVERHGRTLEVLQPKEGVLERFERLSVTGSRLIRACTDEGKVQPQRRYEKKAGYDVNIHLLGIHADEPNRSKFADAERPLVDLGINQKACEQIIRDAGLPVPVKSGCWHCPFMRVGEVIDLAANDPCRFQRIIDLEAASTEKHPPEPGKKRTHWGDKTAIEWRERAMGGALFAYEADDDDIPCVCMDG